MEFIFFDRGVFDFQRLGYVYEKVLRPKGLTS